MLYIFSNLLNLTINKCKSRWFNGRDTGQDQMPYHFSLANKCVPIANSLKLWHLKFSKLFNFNDKDIGQDQLYLI